MISKYTIHFFLIALPLFTACERNLSSNPSDGISPTDSLVLIQEAFDNPTECRSCHPNHYAEWQKSMHAYAFVDPIFFRLNEIGQQRSGNQLDQFCVKCHSPIASLLQEAPPGFDPNAISALAQTGVQCDVCHAISEFEPGRGIAEFRLDGVKQGPIPDPQSNSFHKSEFDRRYLKSGICSGCHDVFAPNGVQVEFTSTEWENSPFSAMGLECQGCHMPTYTGEAAVGGPQREVHRHTFIGVDIPLVDFPGKSETIAMVDELLKGAVNMTVNAPDQIASETDMTVQVEINNDITGHNVPSGTTFERQMWLEVQVTNAATGAVIYESGHLDDNGDLLNHHSEAVKNGALPEDADLTLFHGIPYKNGEETLFFWEADRIEDKTIPPFESRAAEYQLDVPASADALELSVRLRFRSFPPYLLRAIGMEELLPNLLIFDMQKFEQTISVIQ